MACRDYRALLPDYASDKLPAEQAALVKDHLPQCDTCRETIRFLKMDDAAVHAALIGARKPGDVTARRRLIRGIVFLVVISGLVLVTLWVLYETPFFRPLQRGHRPQPGPRAIHARAFS